MSDKVIHFLSHSGPDPFDVFFDTAPVFMHSVDSEGVLQRVSTFWADHLGYSKDEMLGHPVAKFMSPGSQSVVPKNLEALLIHGSSRNLEYDFVAKNGAIVSVLLSATSQYDQNGDFLQSIAVMFDNTATKRAQAELRQKQRMEAIGQLVGGVAHDFNNLLSVIQGNLEFLQDDLDHPQRTGFLHDALGAAKRGGALTEQLLSFGRKAYLRPAGIDLNGVIRDNESMLRRLVPSNISFELVTAGSLWSAELDRTQLETAILNVVNNARDAMPDGGCITMETANVRVGPNSVHGASAKLEPGRYVMLAISDTGTGMTEEVADRVFEPFFTTRPVERGSGLGLSMVHGFVNQSSGSVRIYSEVGIGTTVKMYFPVKGADDGAEAESERDGGPTDGPLMADVLVVEDETDVRKVLVQQLTGQGVNVAEASSGDLAHGLLVTGYRPRILITDVVMPGKLQGPDLAEVARELVPDIKVVYISGYPQEASMTDWGMRIGDVQLPKPVPRSKLIKTVQDMLKKSV